MTAVCDALVGGLEYLLPAPNDWHMPPCLDASMRSLADGPLHLHPFCHPSTAERAGGRAGLSVMAPGTA